MLSMRAVHAGDGYTYLLNSVASHDDQTRPEMGLHDYYDATGTPPGRWFGRGISGLGETSLTPGGVVEETQMAALYGEGLHPDAEKKIADGARVVETQLGRQYPTYSKGVAVLEAIKREETRRKTETGKLLTTEERNQIGLDVARPFYEAATGRVGAGAREVLAWLNEEKNKVKQPVAGMDLTFSPAKSISIVWALADERTAKAIQDIHERSVRDALSYIENELLYTRTGAKGERQIKAKGMLAATFVHYDTRMGDPDLHTHCLISNKVQAEETDGLSPEEAARWRALDTRFLFKNSAKIGQIYTRMMNQRLREELGLAFRQRDTGEGKAPTWEIAGVSDELIDSFSGRRATARPVYEKYAADYATTHGHQPSTRARYALWQQAILDTRDAKKPAQSLRDHRAHWALHYDAEEMKNSIVSARDERLFFPQDGAPGRDEAVADLARKAVEDTRARRAHFAPRHLDTAISMRLNEWRFYTEADEKKVRDAASRYAYGQYLTVVTDTPDHTLPRALVREDGMVVDRDSESVTLIARETLREENLVLDHLGELTAYTVESAVIDAALANHTEKTGLTLNAGQALLVRHLVESGRQITAGVGPAGTGKTASMAVVSTIWKNQGRGVIGLAPSAAAAKNLAEDINTDAFTLASLTYRWRGIVGDNPRDVSALGIDINPGDMLLIDEAGMATTADLAAITEIAQETGAVVRMVGDPHQLDAVETGGLFRTIVKRDDSIELDQVMRMGSDTAQAQAGLSIRHGDASGLDLYFQRGWVHEDSRAEMVAQAARDFLTDDGAGLSSILIASTREDVNTANQIIQDARAQEGRIDPDGPHVELGTGHRAFIGETILTRKNATFNGQRVLNGSRLTLSVIHEDGSITARFDERGVSVHLPADYVRAHVQLGYAATVHRAQGVTVDVTRAIIGAEADRRGLYVALTRGKRQNHVYVPTDMDIDFEAEGGHLHMAGDRPAPTAREILEAVVTRDTGQESATDTREKLRREAASPERARELYATAADMLTTKWRRDFVEPNVRDWLDTLPVGYLETIDEDQAVERISTAAVALARHGVDYRDLMADATSDLEGARDAGAVIAHRLRGHLPDTAPKLWALPPRHAGMDTELYNWAENTHAALQPNERELRELDYALPEKGTITGKDFTNTDLRGKDLSHLKFENCDFTGAALDNAEMHRTFFTDCAMRDATLTGIQSGQGATPFKINSFTHCDLRGADFSGARLARMNLTQSNLSGSVWQGADLETVNFTSSDLTGASFADVTFSDRVRIIGGTLDPDAPEILYEIKEASRLDLSHLEETNASTTQDSSSSWYTSHDMTNDSGFEL